jgi:hypothetical protein
MKIMGDNIKHQTVKSHGLDCHFINYPVQVDMSITNFVFNSGKL